ncbi:MAG: hypothetical protein AAFW65_07590 [Pseudomonadota bacterium]
MGNLVVDPLAIAALVGFAILILMMVGLAIWVVILSRLPASKTADATPIADNENQSRS